MLQSRSTDGFGWRSRGYLPHFDNGLVPQFVTARLADSMPQHLLRKWEVELERGEITDADLRRRIEGYLDSGYGECHLRIPDVARMVVQTLLNGDGVDFDLHSYVAMPNHIHWLYTPLDSSKLERIIQDIKSITAHRANKLVGRKGRFWFPEPFDRFIREPQHFYNVRKYIENNPVKAKLCRKPELWPYTSAGKLLKPPFWELDEL